LLNNIRSLAFPKWLKRLGYLCLGLIFLALLAWFSLRNYALSRAWDKAVSKMQSKGYVLSCEKKSFSGWFTLDFENTQLSLKRDTLLYCKKLEAGISLWKTIWNGPSLSSLNLEGTRISLRNDSSYCNYCQLQGQKDSSETKSDSDDPLVQRVFDLVKRTVAKIPGELVLKDFRFQYTDTLGSSGMRIPEVNYSGKELLGELYFIENNNEAGFKISGDFDRRNLTGKLLIKPAKTKWVELPGLKSRLGIAAGFESAEFMLEELDMKRGVLNVIADGHFKGITIDDRRIADTSVIVRECSGKLVAHFGEDFLEIDSNTELTLNKIKTNLYARADLGAHKAYTLKCKAQKIQSTDFFASLPTGMFANLEGIQTAGELEYLLYVHLDDKDPYAAVLESELKPYNFKITGMGKTDLRKMNGSFTHTFFEKGKAVRSFVVGPSNPSFTPLDLIPEVLKNAVMTGEDPAFFGHNGFYKEAFRQSLARNYEARRFARGGSTISMQLVKNVFLSRKKTLARKVEEVLIVWLIESQRLTSKSRMFEVYLNVIEWGPGVFGIGEAAPFYFNKPASQLLPLESAFLASIVPRPKHYQYFLDSTGQVSNRNWNFVAIRNRMIQKGMIDARDSASFNVKITGPASRYLQPKIHDSALIVSPLTLSEGILEEE